MKKIYLFIFAVYNTVCFSQQYEQMLHKPYSERAVALQELYPVLIALNDSVAVHREVEKIDSIARVHKDEEMRLEMELFKAYYFFFIIRERGEDKYDLAIAGLLNLAETAKAKKTWHIQAKAYRVISEIYWLHIKNYELAFEYHLLKEKVMEQMSLEEFPDMAADLLGVGGAYYYFQDYDRAQDYLKRIIAIPETDFNTLAISSAKNTLGLYYRKTGDYNTSDDYFNQILASPFPASIENWEGIAKGNLGINFYYRGNYEESIPLLEFDYKKAEETKDYGLAAGAMIVLADIYLRQNKPGLSKEYIDRAKDNIIRSGQTDRLRLLYPVMSKWYGVNNQRALSEMYLDSTVIAIGKYHEKFSALKILRVQQRMNLQQRNLEIAQAGIEKQKTLSQRNWMAVFALLLLFTGLSYYFSQQKRQKIKDLKLQISNQKLEATAGELEAALSQVNRFARSLSEKSKIIQQLQNHFGEEKDTLVQQLQQSTILTDDDWREFQLLFDKAYPGFIQQLKNVFPNISQAEARLLLLIKLNFSLKEMPNILGISYDSIRVSWYRMLKKIGQPSNLSPEALLNKVQK